MESRMNYFPFHVGDYMAHTAHLEPLEDLAYRRLLDLYYLRESPLPADVAELARLIRLRSSVQEIEAVLGEFFSLTDEGWSHVRCDAEISKMQDKQQKARASAQASVNARSANAQRTLSIRSTDAELPTPTPTPTPIEEEANASVGKLPTCPQQKLIDLYHEHLPELPAVRLINDSRKRALSSFWRWVLTSKKSDGQPRAQDHDQAMAWIGEYFLRVRQNAFLMGQDSRKQGHESWQCDLDFLLTDKGKKHVIEKTREAA